MIFEQSFINKSLIPIRSTKKNIIVISNKLDNSLLKINFIISLIMETNPELLLSKTYLRLVM